MTSLQEAYDAAFGVWVNGDREEAVDAAQSIIEALDTTLGFGVWCAQHGERHGLTIRDAERLVYTLQGQLADALTEPESDRQEAGEPGWEVANRLCPLEALRMGRDGECYLEHVDEMLEARLCARNRTVTGETGGDGHGGAYDAVGR